MKAALLISGYLRTLEFNLNNIEEKILKQFEKVDVYLHITKDEETTDKYFNHIQHEKLLKLIKQKLNPVCILFENNIKFDNNPEKNNLFNAWFKFYKLNTIKKLNEGLYDKYDIVIKTRPDLFLISSDILKVKNENIIYLPQETLIDKHKLTKETDPSKCDIFAYGSSEAMNSYFDIYNNLEEITEVCGYVPETVMHFYLQKLQPKFLIEEVPIEYNVILSMCNVFAVCGDSGSGKTTLSEILKNYFSNSFTLECDRYHKWERSDENWKQLSHLNPEANFLSKMKKDIFDLKIGKNIYHVDYNHQTGKFTPLQQIKTSDNIIVCGLHSLYSDLDNAYNLKIFLDTDPKLKKKWKLIRDVTERKKTIEQVLSQIEQRKDDYYKHIDPQKDNSDLIVNFYTNDSFSLENYQYPVKVHLNLFVKNKHSRQAFEIQQKLNNSKIDYSLSLKDTFYCFSFLNYQKSDLFETAYNNFYDYIMFFILSLNSN